MSLIHMDYYCINYCFIQYFLEMLSTLGQLFQKLKIFLTCISIPVTNIMVENILYFFVLWLQPFFGMFGYGGPIASMHLGRFEASTYELIRYAFSSLFPSLLLPSLIPFSLHCFDKC